ncbi:hypothetical protein M6B38_127530 [Iris pallida]|uniref:Secreted protein n=1 Tax=Iris pallida TaxID=29817 RepID=A0AAX6G683_IRIPA|nr:hypothetical protein M6B38_127530 [Iris pallida]
MDFDGINLCVCLLVICFIWCRIIRQVWGWLDCVGRVRGWCRGRKNDCSLHNTLFVFDCNNQILTPVFSLSVNI